MLLASALVLLTSRGAGAQDAAFSSSTLAPTPESHALSGARGQTGDDAATGATNPAALAFATEGRLACSHLRWADGLAREWIAVSGSAGGFTLGVDAGILRAPSLPGYDEAGETTGDFRASEWNLGFATARRIGTSTSLGVGIRAHRLSEPGASLGGLGFALGATHTSAAWTCGASVRDLGTVSGENAAAYRLPTRASLGVERAFGRGALLALTCDHEHGGTSVRFGSVLAPIPSFELMGGTSLRSGTEESTLEWGGGVRVRLSRFSASYAYHAAGDLGATHQIGIELPFTRRDSPWKGI